jgi:hypothetical protein
MDRVALAYLYYLVHRTEGSPYTLKIWSNCCA